MSLTLWILAVVVSIAMTGCHGHPRFQQYIPNGDNVPHPCNSSLVWKKVGHLPYVDTISRPKTEFGLDFYSAYMNLGKAKAWAAICQMDSDKDGQTNGAELGDPDCLWVIGDTPSMEKAVSHPGLDEKAYRKDNC